VNAPTARSYLFVPGNRPERFDKALAAGADAVIVDLEDAVPPEGKVDARAAVAGWLSAQRPVIVRINAPGTAWFGEDLALCAMAGVAGVMIPKAENITDLQRIATVAMQRPLYPLIETAQGFDHARTLARAEGVQRLVFGSIDFQLDLGIRDDDEALLTFRSQLVLISRLAGIAAPVDGVTTAIDDVTALERETLRARNLGFGAKLCIHPRQVAIVNRGFAPSADDVTWARRVLAAAEDARGGAVALDGKMIDKPVILRAQAIVREAEARNQPPE